MLGIRKSVNILFPTLLIFILFYSQVHAQYPEPTLTFESDYFSNVELNDPPVEELKERSSELGLTNFRVKLNYPFISENGETMFFVEGLYKHRHFTYSKWPKNISKEIDHLHEINLGLTYYRNIGNNWFLSVNVTPLLASNFKSNKIEKEDLKLNGAITFEKIFNDKWAVGFGASYSSSFGKPLPIPLITFRYESGNKWYAYGALPSDAYLFYRLSSKTDIGLSVLVDGAMYHLSKTLPKELSIDDPELQYVSIIAGPSAVYRLSSLEFMLKGGMSYQRYGVHDGSKEIKDFIYKIKIGAAISASVKLTF